MRRCISTKEARPSVTGRVLYWSVQTMTDEIADAQAHRVVITGASRGLGSLLASAFSGAGARVALIARTEKDLKALAEDLPGPSLVLAGDVTDEDFNESVADATVAEWGGLAVWI